MLLGLVHRDTDETSHKSLQIQSYRTYSPIVTPQDTHDIGADTPQPKTAIMATSTQTKAPTTTATTYATVTAGGGRGGGGRGGGGRGGAPAGHPANGKLIGNPPHNFMGDRTRSKKFLLEFELY